MEYLRENETLEDLQLNGIHIIQKKDSFRFGIDAVLLANFVKVNKRMQVMDICSGTGIIPFIIAGKSDVPKIKGIEIQEEMVEMATRSVKYNGLSDRIEFINEDLKNLESLKKLGKYEAVTVNPPYKLYNSGKINYDIKSAIARHEICCTLEDVIVACKTLMKQNGKMYMVHRPERIADILYLMKKYKIEPKRMRMVHPYPNKVANIVLIEGQNFGGSFLKWEPPLYVYDENGCYSNEIKKIYGREEI